MDLPNILQKDKDLHQTIHLFIIKQSSLPSELQEERWMILN